MSVPVGRPRRRRKHNYPNPEDKIQQELEAEINRYADILSNEMGPAPGSDQVSDAMKVRMWGQADPIVETDPEAFRQALLTGALAAQPEMLDPQKPNSLGIVRAYPAMAQILAEPVDEQMADQIMRYARWPLRSKLLEEYAEDPEGYVKEANRLEGLWNKSDSASATLEEPEAVAPPVTQVTAPEMPATAPPPPPAPTEPIPAPQAPTVSGTAPLAPALGG